MHVKIRGCMARMLIFHISLSMFLQLKTIGSYSTPTDCFLGGGYKMKIQKKVFNGHWSSAIICLFLLCHASIPDSAPRAATSFCINSSLNRRSFCDSSPANSESRERASNEAVSTASCSTCCAHARSRLRTPSLSVCVGMRGWDGDGGRGMGCG